MLADRCFIYKSNLDSERKNICLCYLKEDFCANKRRCQSCALFLSVKKTKKPKHESKRGRSWRQHSDSFQIYTSMPFTNQQQNKGYFLHLGGVLDYTHIRAIVQKNKEEEEEEMLKNCCKLHARPGSLLVPPQFSTEVWWMCAQVFKYNHLLENVWTY